MTRNLVAARDIFHTVKDGSENDMMDMFRQTLPGNEMDETRACERDDCHSFSSDVKEIL